MTDLLEVFVATLLIQLVYLVKKRLVVAQDVIVLGDEVAGVHRILRLELSNAWIIHQSTRSCQYDKPHEVRSVLTRYVEIALVLLV